MTTRRDTLLEEDRQRLARKVERVAGEHALSPAFDPEDLAGVRSLEAFLEDGSGLGLLGPRAREWASRLERLRRAAQDGQHWRRHAAELAELARDHLELTCTERQLEGLDRTAPNWRPVAKAAK